MVLDYAKTRSDATVMREGGADGLEAHKRKRLAEKGWDFLSLLVSGVYDWPFT